MNPGLTGVLYATVIVMSGVMAWLVERSRHLICKIVGTFLVVVPIAILCGFRDVSVGQDTAMYMDAFESVLSGTAEVNGEWSRFEPGFKFLYLAMMKATEDVSFAFTMFYLLVYALAFVGFLMMAKWIRCDFAWVAYLFLCMLPSCNAMRQTVPLSLAVLAFALWLRQYKVMAWALLVCGSLFHVSGAFYFLFLPCMFEGRRFFPLYVVGVTLLLSVFTPTIIHLTGYGVYADENTGNGIRIGLKTMLSISPLLVALCGMRRRVQDGMVDDTQMRLVAMFIRMLIILLLAQVTSFYTDWSLRLTLCCFPFIAMVISFVVQFSGVIGRMYGCALLLYNFVYLCIICNDNGCNAYLLMK